MKNILPKIRQFIKKSWEEGTQIESHNIATVVFIGAPGHFLIYFYNIYLIQPPYESLTYRLIVAFLCASNYFYPKLPEKIKRHYFPFYWHLVLMMSLPIKATFFLLQNNFHEVYLYWSVFLIFLLAIYVPNWFIFLVDFVLSIAIGIILALLVDTEIILDPKLNVAGYVLVITFTSFFGIIFVRASRQSWLNKQRQQLISLAGSIAHEMRNPLNAINMAVNNLDRSDSSQTIDQTKEIVGSSIKRAENIIEIILNNLKGKDLDPKTFTYLNITKVIKKALKSYGYQSSANKSLIDNNIGHDFYVNANENVLIFVLFNIMKNALYYSDTKEDFNIIISSTSDHKYNIIAIEDNGPGIKDDVIPYLFDSFYTVGKSDGTGLGLSFCKKMMLAFGGDIICESECGKWTKFSLLFPKLSEEQLAKINVGDQTDQPSDLTITNNPSLLATKTILIADDELTNLMMMSRYISKFGAKVDQVSNGEALLETFKGQTYDIIISDVNMPGMLGDEVTREIRKYEIENNQIQVPIIAFTGDMDPKKIAGFTESGMNGYFVKGDNPELLIKLILNLVL